MKEFKQNGAVIALLDKPKWVCRLDNGAYGLCKERNAEGVVIGRTVFNLPGHEISSEGTVTYADVDTGAYMLRRMIETEQTLTDFDLANIEAQQEITELELIILEGK